MRERLAQPRRRRRTAVEGFAAARLCVTRVARLAARSNAVRVGRCPSRASREPDTATVIAVRAVVEMAVAGMAVITLAWASVPE